METDPAAAPPASDPAPWGLKGALVVTALSLGAQLALGAGLGLAAAVMLTLLDPGLAREPAALQDAVIAVILGPVAILSWAVTLALVYVSVTAICRRPLLASLRLRRPAGAGLIGTLALGSGVALASTALMRLAPPGEPLERMGPLTRLAESGPIGAALWATLALLMAPPVEEILFRGYAYLGARRSLGPAWAGILVSAVFVLLHTGETGACWQALSGIAALASVLVLVMERTGNLTYCICCHLGYNAALASLTLFGGG